MTENNFDTAFNRVSQLVADFQANEKRFTTPDYSEAQARIDFIDKFFIALGWDVNHELQTNPYAQEVKVERGVKTGATARKRADYAFLAQNFRDVRFFVEAKKPFVELDTPDNCFQVVRYGWSANAPLSILTDFQGLRVLDCRYKPDIQTAMNRIVKTFHYTDYADKEKFAEIYYLFGRDAVLNNSLETFAANLHTPSKAGKQSKLFKSSFERIDTTFLLELDEIRGRLATSFKATNPNFDGEGLTEATQKTIDRLVFMRFLEDKLIEETPIFEDFERSGEGVWQSFINRSRELDRIYNGIIFKSHVIDAQGFKVDAQVFGQICAELSPKESPYDFNAIPIEILGNIYERFLGKIIVVDETTGAAKIEEKPEVRKAGGVYYTPEYIVRYIVENTVGEIVKGKTPQETETLRFADIACGSGSFLIGVYDYLLRFHAEFYNKPKNRKAGIKAGCIETETGSLRLNLAQRTNILLDNIFGVDVDAQAVEVSQLSLFLKLLEDETTASARKYQQQKFKLLPTLDKNIVHGNALIDWDILEGQLFETREQRKLNPMSYVDKFPEAMKAGGFDAIVGNPPYGAELSDVSKKYLENKFELGNTDTACLFMSHARTLTSSKGRVAFIVPKPFLYASNWHKIRAQLLPNLLEIVDCGKVWKEVKLEQTIYRYAKNENPQSYFSALRVGETIEKVGAINKDVAAKFEFILNGVSIEELQIGLKIKNAPKNLNDYVKNQRGCMYNSLVGENGNMFVLGGKQVGRYRIANDAKGKLDESIIKDEKAFIKDDSILVQNIVAHVANPKPHIIIIATIPESLDKSAHIIVDTINQLENKKLVSSKFILGVLNSKLISWYAYRFIFANAIRTMHFDATTTEKIPFPKVELKDKKEFARHDKMTNLVEQMLATKREQRNALTDSQANFYRNKIAALDRQIDALVYELYELTPDEINIIENS